MVIHESDELPEDRNEVKRRLGHKTGHHNGAADNETENKNETDPSPAADEDDGKKQNAAASEAQEKTSPTAAEHETTAPPVSPNDNENAETPKRNCGRTGPTSQEGRSKIAMNSLQHGCCAKTLIMPWESEQRWLKLLADWESAYPGDHPLLHEFITRTAQAEWQRIRCQGWYDDVLDRHGFEPYNMDQEDRAHFERQLRYLTTAERRFQREYKMLEYFYEKNGKREKAAAAQPEPKKEDDPASKKEEDNTEEEEQEQVMPDMKMLKFWNAETGEYYQNGKYYPGPPDWVPEKIIPGVFPPNDIRNWKYKGDPKDRFKKKKPKKR